jgi:hypothetical protein
MLARLQNVRCRAGVCFRRAVPGSLLLLLLVLPRLAAAQAPPSTIARVTGDDISVSGPGGTASLQDSWTIYLSSGSEITVHAGQARIEFVNGGVIGVCGPAKLKLLESSGAFTLAMDFGRLHILLDNATPLVIYTPMMVAVPLAISEASREATLGLEPDGSMCVRATRGGVRLQQQFNGETLVVPEPQEMFLSGGQLHPVPGGAGTCQCGVLPARAIVPAVPKARTEKTAENVAPPSEPPAKKPATVAREYSVPAKPAESKPAEKKPAQSHPATEAPVWKVVMPALVFDASSPDAQREPNPDTILLVREVRVEPDWVFHGRVEAREEALPVVATPKPAENAAQPKAPKKNDTGGIKGFFRRIFGGGAPCAGAGCPT